jgi:protocatechuate 3,4-dioxygenase beta subunit
MPNRPAFCSIFVFIFFGSLQLSAQEWNPQSTPTRAYRNSNAVFSAKILQVASQNERPAKDRANFAVSNETGKFFPTVKIQKMYKRADAFALSEGDELVILPDQYCATIYSAGEDWLFYASYSESYAAWMVSDCYRTKPLSAATTADDLKFFESLPNSSNRSRISGIVQRLVSPASDGKEAVYEPLPNVEVLITVTDYSKSPEAVKSFTVKTDKDGVYELYDAPQPGVVNIYPTTKFENSKIEAAAMSDNHYTLEQKKIFAAGTNFLISKDLSLPRSFIRGKVTDENGQPVQDVAVKLIGADGKIPAYVSTSQTDREGNFYFELNSTGDDFKFILVANDELTRFPHKPFPTTFFPGTTDKTKAKIVSLKSGQMIENLNIKFPSRLKDKTVTGRAVFRDGTPVLGGGNVIFDGTVVYRREFHSDFINYYYFPANTEINKNGDFSLTAIETSDGFVKGGLLFERAVLEKCLNRKLDLPEDQQTVYVRSKPQRLVVNQDVKDVELKFAISPCQPLLETPTAKPERGDYPSNSADAFARYGRQVGFLYPKNAPPEKRPQFPEYYDYKTPRNIYENSPLIVAGRIEKFLYQDRDDPLRIYEKFPENARNLILVKIEKLYKPGDIFGVETGDSIYLTVSPDDKFKAGERRIFYLGGRVQQWLYRNTYTDSEIVWGANFSIDPKDLSARPYLSVLEAPEKRHTKKITGYIKLVKRIYKIPGDYPETTEEPVKDFEVRLLSPDGGDVILGKKYFSAKTDGSGFYEFGDLPAGEFWILASSPKYEAEQGGANYGKLENHTRDRAGDLINLSKQDEIGVNFFVDYRGEITGRVLDEKGNPVQWAQVAIFDYKTFERPLNYNFGSYLTNEKGEYGLWRIPPGKYALAVVPQPFRIIYPADYVKTYYPGTTEKMKALPVEITETPPPKILDIKVSERIPRKIVSGTVDFINNAKNPAGEIFVTYDGAVNYELIFHPAAKDTNSWYQTKTIFSETKVENGKFSISVPENTSGAVRAYTFLSAEKAARCLAGQDTPKSENDGFVKIYSTAANVSVKTDIENIKLIFTIPPTCF